MHTNKCLATVETPAVFYAQWFPTCPCAGHLFQVCSQFSSHNLFDSLPICFSWYLLFSLFISVAYSTYSVLLLSMLVSNPCSVAISHWFHSWCKLFPFICHHLLVSSLLRANLLPQVTQDFECIRTVCKPMCIERFPECTSMKPAHLSMSGSFGQKFTTCILASDCSTAIRKICGNCF